MFNTGSRLTVYGSRLKRLKDYHENTRIRQGLILRGLRGSGFPYWRCWVLGLPRIDLTQRRWF